MKSYIKLLNFELERFIKVYLFLLGITLVLQIVGIIGKSINYINRVHQVMTTNKLSQAQFLSRYGTMSFSEFLSSSWFLVPIIICITIMGLYIFIIWYRDWFGRSAFIYRLLMLPNSRLTIYFSKATVIFLSVLGLVAFQVILLPLENSIFKASIPSVFRYNATGLLGLAQQSLFVNVVITTSLDQFLLTYFIGFMFVLILFTGILFERSFRIKGIGLGLLYVIVTSLIFISPILVYNQTSGFFYPIEILITEVVISLLLTACSILVSAYLLKRKITV